MAGRQLVAVPEAGPLSVADVAAGLVTMMQRQASLSADYRLVVADCLIALVPLASLYLQAMTLLAFLVAE